MANKRLIDANALDELGELPYVYNPVADGNPWYRADDVWACIDGEPTVDAVPVIHAHWEDGFAIHNGKEVYKSIDCSLCNDIFKIESHDREYWKKRFKVCPFCGAVMDGERREG